MSDSECLHVAGCEGALGDCLAWLLPKDAKRALAGVATHACNPSTCETKTEGPQVQSQLGSVYIYIYIY